jgi:hypothetical protein
MKKNKRTYDVVNTLLYYRVVKSHLNGKIYLQKKDSVFLFFHKWTLIAIPFKDEREAVKKAAFASIKIIDEQLKELERC